MIRRHHRITHATALTLALAATAAPCAWADPAPLARAEAAIAARQTPASPVVRPNADQQPAASFNAATGPAVPMVSDDGSASGTRATRVLRVIAPADGFDWRDAGIGAGASLLLVGIGLAGTRAAMSSRKRDIREQQATATG
jgi:hypothetical protein